MEGLGAGTTQKIDGARAFRENLDRANANRWVFIGRDGWPVAGIMNRPVITFLRRLIHTRKVERYHKWLKRTGISIEFSRPHPKK